LSRFNLTATLGPSPTKVPPHKFFLKFPPKKVKIYFCQKRKKKKKKWGSPTSVWREHVPKNTLNLKNQTSWLIKPQCL